MDLELRRPRRFGRRRFIKASTVGTVAVAAATAGGVAAFIYANHEPIAQTATAAAGKVLEGAQALAAELDLENKKPLGEFIAVADNRFVRKNGKLLVSKKETIQEITFKPFDSPSNPGNKIFAVRVGRPSRSAPEYKDQYGAEVTTTNLKTRHGTPVFGSATGIAGYQDQVDHNGQTHTVEPWYLFTNDNGIPVDPTTNQPRIDGENHIKFYIGWPQVGTTKPLQKTFEQQFNGKPETPQQEFSAGK